VKKGYKAILKNEKAFFKALAFFCDVYVNVAVNKAGVAEKIGHISTVGEAALNFLRGRNCQGLKP
jgi:3-phosphoglycerate kinase